MSDPNDFFFEKNIVKQVTKVELAQTNDYLEVVKAFARTTYTSIYVIDYQKKGFEYVSENPLFLCGNTPEEVQDMGYDFYFKYVPEKDLELLLKINILGFDFYDRIPINERNKYSISYDFHIKNQENKVILINQKLTPLFLTNEGKIWKAMCVVSLSSEKSSGNVKIHKIGENKMFEYDFIEESWTTTNRVELTIREKEILQLSTRGFTINEIADSLSLAIDTIKFHRKKLFDKLEVNNITEAITCAFNNKLI